MNAPSGVAAIILAAGLSRRMGRPKMLLPWAGKTVIETVATTLLSLELAPLVVVTGGGRAGLEALLAPYPLKCIFNPAYENGEMVDSIQAGLQALPAEAASVLVALGDQPQMEAATVTALLEDYQRSHSLLTLPSYRMRRGHPWLIGRASWAEILALRPPLTMRDFFRAHAQEIRYVSVETPSILADLDTPEDYEAQRPKF